MLIRSLLWLAIFVVGGCASGELHPAETDAAVGPDAPTSHDGAVDGGADSAVADSSPGDPDAALPDAASPPDAAFPPDADTSPDAEPCTPAWYNLLANADFDLGHSAWSEEGADIISQAGVTPHSGMWFARVSSYTNGVTLWQAVAIPADATALRLREYHCFVTQETGAAEDTMAIELRDNGGGFLETVASLSNLDGTATCNWGYVEYTGLGVHAGQTIRLAYENDPDGDSNLTSFNIDTVSLEVYACP